MLSSLVIAFLPRSTCLLISWLQLPSAVILEPKKIVCYCFHCFPVYLPWNQMPWSCFFWVLSFKPAFSLSSFTFLKRLFAFRPKGGVICISEVIDISSSNLDSSLCFIQPGILHDVLCIEVKLAWWYNVLHALNFAFGGFFGLNTSFRDLNSPTRGWTQALAMKALS